MLTSANFCHKPRTVMQESFIQSVLERTPPTYTHSSHRLSRLLLYIFQTTIDFQKAWKSVIRPSESLAALWWLNRTAFSVMNYTTPASSFASLPSIFMPPGNEWKPMSVDSNGSGLSSGSQHNCEQWRHEGNNISTSACKPFFLLVADEFRGHHRLVRHVKLTVCLYLV